MASTTHDYAGFTYEIIEADGALRAVPHPGQHRAAAKEKHLRAAVETFIQDHNWTPTARQVGEFDLTPTWRATAEIIIAALQDGTPTGKQRAREELRRMADAADRYNAMVAAASEDVVVDR